MYMESLHVKNVGPFNKLNVKFNPKMNVVVGTNGVGKTSLLRCIAYSQTNHYLENVRFRKGASIKMKGVVGDKKYLFGAENLVDKDQQYRQTDVKQYQLRSDDGYEGVNMFQDNDYNLLAIGAYRFISYKRIDGMIRENNVVASRKNYRNSNPIFLETSQMPDIKQWMINRYFQIDKEWAEVEKSNWNSIMSKLNLISPRNAEFHFVKIERDLEPIFSINGSECYLEELSSGFKSVLSIVLNIVDWIEAVNEGDNMKIDNAEGTVLIDEIDAHLHPSWQSTILTSLREIYPNLQFVVTTHSPNVIISAKEGEVILFNNYDGVVNAEPEERSFGGWQFNDILSDLMQSPDLDRVSLIPELKKLNEAYEQKDIKKFETLLNQVSKKINPNDSILKVYNLKLSELKLNI